MANIDYAFKAKVLNNHQDLLKQQRRSSLYDYSVGQYEYHGVLLYALKTAKKDYKISTLDLVEYCRSNGLLDELKECQKINNASYKRIGRLKHRIESMLLDGQCLFLTLTFTDKTLSETTAKQRRVAVVRYLKQFNCQYVANIDFGEDNGREHYHAVIRSENIDLTNWRKYGNINVKKIRNKGNDNTKLAKYISKLTNHAIKETTHRNTLIYSR